MMMECPKCGFSQPKDRYCANCGLDVDQYLAKPKPLWVRVLQNPNFHLALIGVLIVGVVSYMYYAQRSFVDHEVHTMLDGRPLTSRDAAVPTETDEAQVGKVVGKSTETGKIAPVHAAPTPAPPPTEKTAASSAPAIKIPDVKRAELSFWEIPREVLVSLIETADKLSEATEGRVYLLPDGEKAMTSIESSSRRLALNRNLALQANAGRLLVETPATSTEAFQFGLLLRIVGVEKQAKLGKVATVKWDSSLVLPSPDSATDNPSTMPSVRSLMQSNVNGTTTINYRNLLVIVIEPSNRMPEEGLIQKAGDGPWAIFRSPAFRSGMTDWVMALQLK